MNIVYDICTSQENISVNKVCEASGYWTVDGQNLTNKEIVKNEPVVYINQKSNDKCFYTLFLVNISDSFLHWWISNIDPINDYSEEWVPYYFDTSTSEEKNNNKHTGINHFVFYLYSHTDIIEKDDIIGTFKFRKDFKLMNWVNKYGLKIRITKYFNTIN
jgi:hypothetical protein